MIFQAVTYSFIDFKVMPPHRGAFRFSLACGLFMSYGYISSFVYRKGKYKKFGIDLRDINGINLREVNIYFQVIYKQSAIKCVICQEKNRSIATTPCNHCVMCEKCAPSKSECPLCRSQISQRTSVSYHL